MTCASRTASAGVVATDAPPADSASAFAWVRFHAESTSPAGRMLLSIPAPMIRCRAVRPTAVSLWVQPCSSSFPLGGTVGHVFFPVRAKCEQTLFDPRGQGCHEHTRQCALLAGEGCALNRRSRHPGDPSGGDSPGTGPQLVDLAETLDEFASRSAADARRNRRLDSSTRFAVGIAVCHLHPADQARGDARIRAADPAPAQPSTQPPAAGPGPRAAGRRPGWPGPLARACPCCARRCRQRVRHWACRCFQSGPMRIRRGCPRHRFGCRHVAWHRVRSYCVGWSRVGWCRVGWYWIGWHRVAEPVHWMRGPAPTRWAWLGQRRAAA